MAPKELGATTILAAPTPEPVMIRLKEDELILPPYLVEFEGGPVLNASQGSAPSRSVQPRELLEYGDRFRLQPNLALWVLTRDHQQWVGGGVFQASTFGPQIERKECPYGVRLDRGWIRVWVDEPEEYPIRIETAHGRFVGHRAQFWIYAQSLETELFLLSGKLDGPDGPVRAGSDPLYLRWQTGKTQTEQSRSWDPDRIERRIKLVYPELWKMVQKAADDWDDLAESTYEELRKKGWRNSTRFAPKK